MHVVLVHLSIEALGLHISLWQALGVIELVLLGDHILHVLDRTLPIILAVSWAPHITQPLMVKSVTVRVASAKSANRQNVFRMWCYILTCFNICYNMSGIRIALCGRIHDF
jgi:hypothetical protein